MTHMTLAEIGDDRKREHDKRHLEVNTQFVKLTE
jgi:hypothetical protein